MNIKIFSILFLKELVYKMDPNYVKTDRIVQTQENQKDQQKPESNKKLRQTSAGHQLSKQLSVHPLVV
jgi:hypothetical protein